MVLMFQPKEESLKQATKALALTRALSRLTDDPGSASFCRLG
jgi:hypothetical protein